MNIDFQDRIDAYVQGRMSPEDKAKFEEEIRLDEEKQKQFELTRNVVKALKSRNDKLARMEQMKAQYEPHQERACAAAPSGNERRPALPQKKNHKHIFIWVSSLVGAAAILAIGLLLAIPGSYVGNGSIEPAFMETDNFRGDNSLSQIATLINNKQYGRALEAIQATETENRNELDSLLRVEPQPQQKEEVAYQRSVLESQAYTLTWFKANALIGLKRMDEAQTLLNRLRLENGNYKIQADSLYNVLTVQ